MKLVWTKTTDLALLPEDSVLGKKPAAKKPASNDSDDSDESDGPHCIRSKKVFQIDSDSDVFDAEMSSDEDSGESSDDNPPVNVTPFDPSLRRNPRRSVRTFWLPDMEKVRVAAEARREL